MIGVTFSLLLLSSAMVQEPAPNEAAQPRVAPPAPSTSAVRSITTQAAPRAGTPTRVSCGWEGTTGSTMRRRVCREVAANGDTADPEAREMLRQMQGSRYGSLPVFKNQRTTGPN